MRKFVIKVNNQAFEVEVEEIKSQGVAKPAASPVAAQSASPVAEKKAASTSNSSNVVVSPMPGNILKVNVKSGDAVKKGQVLLVLEAMKMENEIQAPADGKVDTINVTVGQCVGAGDVLVALS